MKVADIKLGWIKSPSPDVVKVDVVLTVDGTTTTTTFNNADVQELMITVSASQSVQFKVITSDSEGNSTPSEVYSFVLGDLEPPAPATGLFHEILAVRDVTP